LIDHLNGSEESAMGKSFTRIRLATPGPTEVPSTVLLAGAQELLHHRSPEFAAVMEATNAGLQRVFCTKQPVFTILSGGTGGMEAAVANCFQAGDHVLVVRNGYFGERFADICLSRGLRTTSADAPWGVAVDPQRVAALLDEHRDIKGVMVVYSETSSGGTNDVRTLGEICRSRDALLIVDAISALVAHPCPMDEWSIDVLIGASHKAFMMPPGLAFAGVSDKAWTHMRGSRAGTYYFSFERHRKFWPLSPSSPGVSLVAQLKVALALIEAEGLPVAAARHAKLAEAAQSALQALGFRLFVEDIRSRSHAVTAALAPTGLDTNVLLELLREKYGVTMTGGQGDLNGRLLRLGHIGAFDAPHLISILGALEMALRELGHEFPAGAGVAAVERVYA
jgi:serine---pyruvate transaminase